MSKPKSSITKGILKTYEVVWIDQVGKKWRAHVDAFNVITDTSAEESPEIQFLKEDGTPAFSIHQGALEYYRCTDSVTVYPPETKGVKSVAVVKPL